LGLFFLEIKLLANSRFGKQFQHHDRQMAQTPSVGRPELVGKRGITLTTMAPSGKVKLENEIFEAASLGGLINKDATVEVVRSEHLKLTVKEI
jgi:membrane-bound serine protease (ClpP class)